MNSQRQIQNDPLLSETSSRVNQDPLLNQSEGENHDPINVDIHSILSENRENLGNQNGSDVSDE